MNTLIFLGLLTLPAQAAPLDCAAPVVDRGQIRGGPTLTQRFTLVNRGAVDVTIVEARGSCGCLTPKLSARNLKMGESATLDLEIGTISQPEGPNLWSVRVLAQADGGAPAALDLQVKATLVREVSLEPSAIRLFGGPGLSHEITIIDRRVTPFEVTAVRTSSSRIVAMDAPWQKTAAGWTRRIRVQIASDCPAGKFADFVQILSDDPEYRELQVAVAGERRDRQRYLVTPSEVRLDVKPGKTAPSSLVLIRDRDGQAVEIEKVECDDPALTARFADGAHPTATVRISVDKGKNPAQSSTLRVLIRSPAHQTLTIPVSRD